MAEHFSILDFITPWSVLAITAFAMGCQGHERDPPGTGDVTAGHGSAMDAMNGGTMTVEPMAFGGSDGMDGIEEPTALHESDESTASAVDDSDSGSAEEAMRGGYPPYPMDDTLAINHVQALGTHNSYHLRSMIPVRAWDYTHLPLDRQLGEQGVRQFELDMHYDHENALLEVYHLRSYDEGTTCPTFSQCVAVMKGWSDQNPGHHPIAILLEMKGGYEGVESELVEVLEERLAVAWPRDYLITPDDVQRDAANVRDGLAAYGWPKLGETRGRALFVLHAGAHLRDPYTEGGTTTAGRLMFPDAGGDITVPYAAFHSINDPISGGERIRTAVAAGHVVRTRADTESEQIALMDYSRFEAALESGAHFLSSDFPFPATPEVFGITIPGGTPSRCNPLSAPAGCTAEALEDAARLRD